MITFGYLTLLFIGLKGVRLSGHQFCEGRQVMQDPGLLRGCQLQISSCAHLFKIDHIKKIGKNVLL